MVKLGNHQPKNQVIQSVTQLLSPIVGGHDSPLSSGHGVTHHPKKVTFAELPGKKWWLDFQRHEIVHGEFSSW